MWIVCILDAQLSVLFVNINFFLYQDQTGLDSRRQRELWRLRRRVLSRETLSASSIEDSFLLRASQSFPQCTESEVTSHGGTSSTTSKRRYPLPLNKAHIVRVRKYQNYCCRCQINSIFIIICSSANHRKVKTEEAVGLLEGCWT